MMGMDTNGFLLSLTQGLVFLMVAGQKRDSQAVVY